MYKFEYEKNGYNILKKLEKIFPDFPSALSLIKERYEEDRAMEGLLNALKMTRIYLKDLMIGKIKIFNVRVNRVSKFFLYLSGSQLVEEVPFVSGFLGDPKLGYSDLSRSIRVL